MDIKRDDVFAPQIHDDLQITVYAFGVCQCRPEVRIHQQRLPAECLFHAIEGCDVSLFECGGLPASETHRQECKTIAGSVVAGKFAACSVGVFTEQSKR